MGEQRDHIDAADGIGASKDNSSLADFFLEFLHSCNLVRWYASKHEDKESSLGIHGFIMRPNFFEEVAQVLGQCFLDDLNNSWLASLDAVVVLAFKSPRSIIRLSFFVECWQAARYFLRLWRSFSFLLNSFLNHLKGLTIYWIDVENVQKLLISLIRDIIVDQKKWKDSNENFRPLFLLLGEI